LSRNPNSFFAHLGIVIQKHVIQCSPYTTARHVHFNAKTAALAQVYKYEHKVGHLSINYSVNLRYLHLFISYLQKNMEVRAIIRELILLF
jgi:hypothetical protein